MQDLQAGLPRRRRDPGDRRLRARRRADGCRRRRRSRTTRRRSRTSTGVVDDGVSPPVASDDGEAAEVFVQVDATAEVDEVVGDDARAASPRPSGDGLDGGGHRTGRLHRRPRRRVRRHRRPPAARRARRRLRHPGDRLPLAAAAAHRARHQPRPRSAPSVLAVVAARATPTSCVLNGQTQGILFILVIGAATDYSLLYIARYREALHTHERQVGCHLGGAARRVGADPRLGRHRHRGPALPARQRPQLEQDPRAGRGDRHRVRAARRADPAAGAACSGRAGRRSGRCGRSSAPHVEPDDVRRPPRASGRGSRG